MATSHVRFHESRLHASAPAVLEPRLEEELYETFLKMRDLLEGYAPSWYPEDLREKAEAVVRHIGK